MAEELNMHFSSVFTREDTCSLPVQLHGAKHPLLEITSV